MLPDERVIAWAAYAMPPAVSGQLLAFGMSIVPVVGWVFMGMVASQEQQGVLVLTDRRLLMLKKDKHGCASNGRGVIFDAPLETVHVRRLSDRVMDGEPQFELRVEGLHRVWKLQLKDVQSPAAHRLLDGLEVLGEA